MRTIIDIAGRNRGLNYFFKKKANILTDQYNLKLYLRTLFARNIIILLHNGTGYGM